MLQKNSTAHAKLSKTLRSLEKEDYARRTHLTESFLVPQLATLVEAAPQGEEWIHENKYDGYRILAYVEGKKVKLLSRNKIERTHRFGEIAELIKKFKVESLVIDGEIVAADVKEGSGFSALQQALSDERTDAFTYYVFDILYVNGRDLRPMPLIGRKKILEFLFKGLKLAGKIELSPYVQGQGGEEFLKACRARQEGIISKRAEDPYFPGRGKSWLKVKCNNEEEFVIVGYTEPQGSRVGFGSLLLGYYSRTGELMYAGRVGTGFDEKTLLRIKGHLKRRDIKKSPFKNQLTALERKGAHFTEPKLVAQIRFTEWTSDERLRHPAFLGLREDKSAKEVTRTGKET